MRAWIGAAIVAAALAAAPQAGAGETQARAQIERAAAAAPATEFSSRQRHHRAQRHVRRHYAPHYRRTYVYAPRGYDYYAQPHWYRPYGIGITPMFPFGPWGYGLGPSW